MKTSNSTSRRCRPLLLAASAFGIAVLCAGAAKAWISAERTVHPEGSFLMGQMPDSVTAQDGIRNTVLGAIPYHTISAKLGDASLTIMSSALPDFVTSLSDPDILYRGARNELLEDLSVMTSSFSPCHHAGYSCRALRYQLTDGRHGRARFFMKDRTMVVFHTVYQRDEDIAEQFLASAR